jgi:hypothetical protein
VDSDLFLYKQSHELPCHPLAQRICAVNPNRFDISRSELAFNAYHALRNNDSLETDKAVSSSGFTYLLVLACDVMRCFSGETFNTSPPMLRVLHADKKHKKTHIRITRTTWKVV